MKIKTQDKITLFSALLVGVITGSYLYLVGFVPEFESPEAATEEELQDFMIVGDMYGGMRAGIPPSFQVASDGTYRYIPFSDNPEVPAPAIEGEYPRGSFLLLESAVTNADLVLQSQSFAPEMCAQMVDGIDYRYTIVLDGAEYRLDTCGTNFSADSELGLALAEVWDYFSRLESTE